VCSVGFVRRVILAFIALTVVALFAALVALTSTEAQAQEDPVFVFNAFGLIQEINRANGRTEPTVIVLTPFPSTAFNLDTPDNDANGGSAFPVIVGDVTILAEGATLHRDSTESFRIFRISATGSLTLDNATVSGGSVNANGGAISNEGGTLTLINSTVENNEAVSGGAGIHVVDGGTATLINSTVSGNNASSYGGGIHVDNSTLNLTNSTVSGNTAGDDSGGGIYNDGGQVTLNNSVVSDNSAHNDGGGIYNTGGGVTLINSTVSGNEVGRYGGGISNFLGELTLFSSVISGNSANDHGGGIYNRDQNDPTDREGIASLINSTVSGNAATNDSGGIRNFSADSVLSNSIVRGNDGEDISHGGGTPVTTLNNAVVGTIPVGVGCDETNNCSNTDPAFVQEIDPSHAPTTVGDYRLTEDSPAIDTGSIGHYEDAFDGVPVVQIDRDGNLRLTGDNIDLGAFEFQQANDLEQIYVDATNFNQLQTGRSWDRSFSDLQLALYVANSSSESVDIFVAGGTYYPTPEDAQDPEVSFVMPDGVSLYGGFAGDEDDPLNMLDDRNFESNTTILSGDINRTGPGNSENNTLNVVRILGDATVAIDGVTVTGGRAVATSPFVPGGGISISGSNTKAEFANSIISGNWAGFGGGIGIVSGATAEFTNSIISGNWAGLGGGVYVSGSSNARAEFTNSIISSNQASRGGGVYVSGSSNARAEFTNSIIWGNDADPDPNFSPLNGLGHSATSSLLQGGCAILGSGATCIDSTDGTTAGGAVIDADPLFIDAADPSDAPTSDGDYQLLPGSPAIDAGDNDLYDATEFGNLDLASNDRIVGDAIDLGPYEAQFTNASLDLTVDPTLALPGAMITMEVAITVTGFDLSLLESYEVTLSGLNGDQTISLDDEGDGSFIFPADTAGTFELEAAFGALSDGQTLVIASLPVLTVPSEIAIPAADAAGYDLTTGVSATDWKNETLTVNCEVEGGGSLQVGDNTIECFVEDSLGQQTSDTYVITVASLPELNLPSSVTVNFNQRNSVIWATSATDWTGGDIDVTCTPSSGSSFPVGDTTVQCEATDSLGQIVSGSFVVTVLPEPDPRAPLFRNMPTDIVVPADGPDGTVVEYTMPTAVDDTDGDVGVTCEPESGSLFGIGHNTVTCTATNSLDLTSTGVFAVIVIPYSGDDPDPPDFTPGDDPENPWFWATWARTDLPVRDGHIARTWMWGPGPFTGSMWEPYTTELQNPGGDPVFLEIPDEQREVIYFDKARMEINDPDGDTDSLWYVTNGLLVIEMITGNRQFGDDLFKQYEPSTSNVAGDSDGTTGPTYAALQNVLDAPAQSVGTLLTQEIDRDGNVTADAAWGDYEITVGHVDDVTDHGIAAPFWAFMQSEGLVYDDGTLNEEALFENPFYATGRPITEAYWTTVPVAGEPRDVLLQCFERRCLTWTPGNDSGFVVEAGNVGQHYFTWRYVQQPD
jgi:parallel beta-helix repeat protein